MPADNLNFSFTYNRMVIRLQTLTASANCVQLDSLIHEFVSADLSYVHAPDVTACAVSTCHGKAQLYHSFSLQTSLITLVSCLFFPLYKSLVWV